MKRFVLTCDMIDHLMLINDDATLGKVLAMIFNHKVKGHDFACQPDDQGQIDFIVALLANDMATANKEATRKRRSADDPRHGADDPGNLPLPPEKETKEKEISPHTPYIEKESKEKLSPLAPPARTREGKSDAECLFDQFWVAYPRKVDKEHAHKCYVSLMRKEKDPACLHNRIIRAIEAQRRSLDWQKDNGKYIPHAATWINGKRWEDIVETPVEQKSDAERINDFALSLINNSTGGVL